MLQKVVGERAVRVPTLAFSINEQREGLQQEEEEAKEEEEEEEESCVYRDGGQFYTVWPRLFYCPRCLFNQYHTLAVN